jgi:hypothetical protein
VGTVLPATITNAMSGSGSSNPSISTFASSTLDTISTFLDKGGSLRLNHLGTNEVWQYFRVYNEKRFKTHAYCGLCNKDVFYGLSHATGNLEKHMSRHHKEDYKEIMCERANKRQCTASIHSSQAQTKLTNYVTKCPEYEESLTKWMIQTYQPLKTVEDETFHDMLFSLNKTAPVVSFGKIRTLMSTRYYDSHHTITKILKGKTVALTTDA